MNTIETLKIHHLLQGGICCTEVITSETQPSPYAVRIFGDAWRCGTPAEGVRLQCPSGRPDAVACYCSEHGGIPRADAEARRDWNFLAPASVGDADQVLTAGCMALNSEHSVVVIRREAPHRQPASWKVRLTED